MANDTHTLLRHWGAWARDNGNWRLMCRSIEHRYVFDRERYGWPDDLAKQNRFQYDQKIAERIEGIVTKLIGTEKVALIASYIYFPHLDYKIVAKKLGIPERSFATSLDAAVYHVRRDYE